MRIAIDPIGKPSAGRFIFMKLLRKYLLAQGDEVVSTRDLESSDVYLTHGFDLTKRRIWKADKADVKLVVRQDGWSPANYDKMIRRDSHLLNWLKLLAGVDRVIYQSEFCRGMFKRFNHDISNSIVIHNGVEIPPRTEKKDIFIIYTSKPTSSWWAKLVIQTTDYIKRWCAKNNIQCVEIKKNLNSLPHDKLLNLFAESKYMMHLYPFAPCANVVLEAMAGGTVVIGFDSGGDPELTLEDLLVPLGCPRFDLLPRDITVPKKVVLSILDRVKDNYSHYSDLTRKRILKFDYRRIGQKYREVCLGVLNDKFI